MVFLDSFLLALLSLALMFVPPFRKANLWLFVFALNFGLQGCFKTGLIHHVQLDIANEIVFIGLCLLFYGYIFWQARFDWMTLVPLMFFVVTLGLRYAGTPAIVITGTAVFSALWQVYFLARPDKVQLLGILGKRFYLVMILSIFFDAVYQLFLYLNFPQLAH